jgi:hypothetical protein
MDDKVVFRRETPSVPDAEPFEPIESPETIAAAVKAEAAHDKSELLIEGGFAKEAFTPATLAATIRRSLYGHNPSRYGNDLAASLYNLARATDAISQPSSAVTAEALLEEATYLKEEHAPGSDLHAKLLFELGQRRVLRNELTGAVPPWEHLVKTFADTTSLEIAELVATARPQFIQLIGAETRRALDIASAGVEGARTQVARNTAFTPLLARALSQLGEVTSRRTRHREALTHHAEALQLLESLPVLPPIATAEVFMSRAFSQYEAKSWEPTIESAHLALQMLSEADAQATYDHRQLEGRANELLGFASLNLRNRRDAKKFLDAAIRAYQSLDATDESYRSCIRVHTARAKLNLRGLRFFKAIDAFKQSRVLQQKLDASHGAGGSSRLDPLQPNYAPTTSGNALIP